MQKYFSKIPKHNSSQSRSSGGVLRSTNISDPVEGVTVFSTLCCASGVAKTGSRPLCCARRAPRDGGVDCVRSTASSASPAAAPGVLGATPAVLLSWTIRTCLCCCCRLSGTALLRASTDGRACKKRSMPGPGAPGMATPRPLPLPLPAAGFAPCCRLGACGAAGPAACACCCCEQESGCGCCMHKPASCTGTAVRCGRAAPSLLLPARAGSSNLAAAGTA